MTTTSITYTGTANTITSLNNTTRTTTASISITTTTTTISSSTTTIITTTATIVPPTTTTIAYAYNTRTTAGTISAINATTIDIAAKTSSITTHAISNVATIVANASAKKTSTEIRTTIHTTHITIAITVNIAFTEATTINNKTTSTKQIKTIFTRTTITTTTVTTTTTTITKTTTTPNSTAIIQTITITTATINTTTITINTTTTTITTTTTSTTTVIETNMTTTTYITNTITKVSDAHTYTITTATANVATIATTNAFTTTSSIETSITISTTHTTIATAVTHELTEATTTIITTVTTLTDAVITATATAALLIEATTTMNIPTDATSPTLYISAISMTHIRIKYAATTETIINSHSTSNTIHSTTEIFAPFQITTVKVASLQLKTTNKIVSAATINKINYVTSSLSSKTATKTRKKSTSLKTSKRTITSAALTVVKLTSTKKSTFNKSVTIVTEIKLISTTIFGATASPSTLATFGSPIVIFKTAIVTMTSKSIIEDAVKSTRGTIGGTYTSTDPVYDITTSNYLNQQSTTSDMSTLSQQIGQFPQHNVPNNSDLVASLTTDYCLNSACSIAERCRSHDQGYMCLNNGRIESIKDYLLNAGAANGKYAYDLAHYDGIDMTMVTAARQMMILASSNESLLNRLTAGYKLPEILQECMYAYGGSCKSLFTQNSSSYIYGNCFTFNNDSNFSEYFAERPGVNHGLTLHFALEHSEYLLTTISQGFKIIFHPPNMPIYTSIDGYYMAPRHVNRFTLSYTKSDRLRKCQQTVNYHLPGNLAKYRVEECERKAFQKKFIKFCDCLNPEYPKVPNLRLCNLQDYNCTSRIGEVWYNLTESESRDCRRPCQHEEYSAEILITPYEPKNYRLSGCDLSDNHCLENFKQNTLKAEIYYAKLGYIYYNERQLTSIPKLISEIGAVIALMMGASYLSFVEMMIMLFECWRNRT